MSPKRDRRRRSVDTPSSSCSTTSRTRTRRRCVSRGRSRSRACRRTARLPSPEAPSTGPAGEPMRSRRRRTARRSSSRRSWLTCAPRASRTAGRASGSSSTRSSPTPATYIQAVGEREDATATARRERVGHHDRPAVRHGRPGFIKDAAREANRAGDIDLLCVLGVRVRSRSRWGER